MVCRWLALGQHKLLQLCKLVQNLPWDISLQALDQRALLTGPFLLEWALPESDRTEFVSLSRILIIVRWYWDMNLCSFATVIELEKTVIELE